MINYKHLHYFFTVAQEGSIARASERLHLTPQTISGQLSLLEERLGVDLFTQVGRSLEITEVGQLVLGYADEIFSLGGRLEEVLQQLPDDRRGLFRVGVLDAVPKSIAHRILQPALEIAVPARLICREDTLEVLLNHLSVHYIDLILADRAIPGVAGARGFSHKLGASPISFFAAQSLRQNCTSQFPHCLANMPILLPSNGQPLRASYDAWMRSQRIHPHIVAEFDDSALMKAFGKAGVGVFMAPSVIESEVQAQYQVSVIGRVREIRAEFFVISADHEVSHPCAVAVVEGARELFSTQD